MNFEEEDFTIRFLSYLQLAKDLENDAIKRYEKQIKILNYPELVAYLEGVLKTELRHLDEIEQEINRLKRKLDEK